jgi:methylamine dehydrogenase heavy chain
MNRAGIGVMTRQIAFLAGALVVLAAGLNSSARAQLGPDQMITRELPAVGPGWIFVLDGNFPSGSIAKLDIIDGDHLKMLGQISGGLLSNFVIAPDHHEMYTIDTYYSRGWRGTRTDVISIFDAKTLNFQAEIELPPNRLLIVPKQNTASITSDGAFMLVANMTPASSVSVADLKARKFVGEIETPGCVQAMASGARQFNSMCADGSILTVKIDDSGKELSRTNGKPFFDPAKDPVFDQPAIAAGKMFFASYHGNAHVVDVAGDTATQSADYALVSPADAAEKWRPGGWQTIAADRAGNKIAVLMHQGGEWTHKQFGTEVWVYDTASKSRLARIKLKTPAYSILIGGSDSKTLFATALDKARLESYSLDDGKNIGELGQLGTPYLLYGP